MFPPCFTLMTAAPLGRRRRESARADHGDRRPGRAAAVAFAATWSPTRPSADRLAPTAPPPGEEEPWDEFLPGHGRSRLSATGDVRRGSMQRLARHIRATGPPRRQAAPSGLERHRPTCRTSDTARREARPGAEIGLDGAAPASNRPSRGATRPPRFCVRRAGATRPRSPGRHSRFNGGPREATESLPGTSGRARGPAARPPGVRGASWLARAQLAAGPPPRRGAASMKQS